MKIKNLRLPALLLAFLIVFASYNKDDSVFNETITPNSGDNTGSGDNNSNGENNQNNDEGTITLYRINGKSLEKIEDYSVTREKA